jgi:hypothetical protein
VPDGRDLSPAITSCRLIPVNSSQGHAAFDIKFKKLLRFLRAAVESAQNHCKQQSMTPALAHELR